MLKGIPSILSPKLLMALQEMGHGDVLCIGDGNFPAKSIARDGGAEIIRLDGHGVPEILSAVLEVMPLDRHVEKPVRLMDKTPADKDIPCPIWEEYIALVARHDERGAGAVAFVERFDFYEKARRCFAVVATGEKAVYANIMLQKGVVSEK
ncbi:fucose isomerase [Christensenellaceae bacterium OttesenSCG-928-M15]|nr:fucose isomerase [Christensenellaceae bacterium OttesenSCG-928-M15]